ncbi:P-loop containing nucleoside triphosphate hydrolase protein [Aspergillus heteromorphus CBS 117.55]|uniref:P-loop containing nucleoside triphosphate hydrolase protein n=1 Tax=Aspergillus heteromorphus CBS 117.55 TaxID=1448321 RepID=A0A317WVW4_9EURO|nr:P-loop containing nucleoside triphosphate hydrolase protein [Aspergillus heteromorphus CBS 117.55]PWY89991.1 P-loop containing nucleoside triphosphate hydrolase protein [Aspergillus heteromorphus CBS 117.55]
MTNQSILATCKQTRFHLHDKASKEVDVEGLTIAVSSTSNEENLSNPKSKGKSKAKAETRELITQGHLRLKEGVCYGLIGRNGTGKSTLLRAMADKLIPGIPHATRIAILQQTESSLDACDNNTNNDSGGRNKAVLEYVLNTDRYKNEVVHKIDILSRSFESDDLLQPVRAIRTVRHSDMEKELFLAQKTAHLKSGARGLQARKELKSAESRLQDSSALLNQTTELMNADAIQEDTKAAMETLQDLQSQFESMKVSDTEKQARQILAGLGFQETMLNKPFLELSGGWRMRCMLASVLIQNPDIMILDEPTNFLDLLGVIWLEKYLQQLCDSSQTTILIVSHDRDFVNAVCEEIIILRDQKLSYFKGNLSAYEKDFEEQKLYWGRMKEAQERQVAHMEATIRDNIKIGKKTNDDNKLRMAKSRQKKIDDRMGVQVSATGGRFKLNRDLVGYHLTTRAEIEVPTDERGATMTLPDTTELRFPGPLISLEGVVHRFNLGEPPVLNGIELVMHLGDRVGILGLNGCGKSTLVRLLAGKTLPTQGKLLTHSRLKLGYYAQHSIEELQEQGWSDPDLTALGLMSKDVNGSLNEGELRGLLSTLGLQGRVVSDVPIRRLSGGQLVRLSLARVVWNSPHLLILDEITTHLDFHTVTAISSALSRFNGAILLVSHDRFLIRSVVEGKRDWEQNIDEDFEGIDDEQTELSGRRRDVYVLKAGKLHVQENGVEQFEQSLARRARKMLPVPG